MRIRIFPVALAAFTLAGCAMGWTRPDTTAQQFYQDRQECEQAAVQMYPPAYASTGGYQSPAMTECRSFGAQVECSTMPGAYHPGPMTDANAMNRNMAISQCLRGKGYTYQVRR